MPRLRHVEAAHPSILLSYPELLYTGLSHFTVSPESGCCLVTPTRSEGLFVTQLEKAPNTS